MEKQKIINPATGEIISEINIATWNDLDLAMDSARLAFDKGDWPKISLKERKTFLLKISQLITDKASELSRLETLNTGKPVKETTFMDVLSSAKTFEHFAHNLERYLEGQAYEISQDTKARLKREPLGVTLLIIPWNYPFLIASWKLAQALACGNTVILKPSSLTPLTAMELARIILEAGLPEGVVNIIIGSGDSIGKALCSDKRIDLISFTGSNSVGKKILEYTSQNVKKLIMELGGKSASIVLADADFELAVNGSLCSIFLNQGQMCTAMSRIFVEDDIYAKFIEDFLEKTKRIKLGNGLDYETQMGPLISKEQRDKVMNFVERAKGEGAKLVYGGKIPDSPELKKGFFFEPTIFTEVLPEMQIFQEEVFGPVVCINKFSKIDEAIELANKTDFALAAAIWTGDLSLAEVLANKINAGTIWINTYGMFYNELPYGGFKQSGFGKELGKEGFLEYSRLKNVVSCQVRESKPLVNYWYGF
jgi:betaine-aldehyde dehydrogenase